MLLRWLTPLLGLALPAFTFDHPSFENTAIVRTVDLGGSLILVTTTYTVRALVDSSDVYTVAFGPEEKQKTSWIEAKVKGLAQPLELEDLGYDSNSQSHLLNVVLPNPLNTNSTVHLVLETVQTHATRPWPETAGQQEDQALKYETDLFVLSPYRTSVQRTKLRAPTPRIISFTTPESVDDFTLENPVTKSGATTTYGPYNNVPPSSNIDFIKKHQQPVVIHYNYDQPVLEVTNLKRAVEISHWGANLNIQDEIHLHNAGPALKGQFSRLVHQTQNFYKQPPPHVLPSLTLHLPAGIRDTYIYDLIGNVSTSHLRPASSSSGKNSILEFRPRYPLMGGWNYSFTLGWDSPLADSVSWDQKNERYIVHVPIMTLIPGAVVDDAEINIILPEGATEFEAFPSFPASSSSVSTHTTYLDTTGRPAISFTFKQLTNRHIGGIYVSYKLPISAHLKKPLAVAAAFLGLFALAIGWRRVNLRIHKRSDVK